MSSQTPNPFRMVMPSRRLFETRVVVCRICNDITTRDDLAVQHASCTACFHQECLLDELIPASDLFGDEHPFSCPFCDDELCLEPSIRGTVALGREAGYLVAELPRRVETALGEYGAEHPVHWVLAVKAGERYIRDEERAVAKMGFAPDVAIALLKERTAAHMDHIIQVAKNLDFDERDVARMVLARLRADQEDDSAPEDSGVEDSEA